MPVNRTRFWSKTLVILLVTLFAVFAYTFLHESGHALVILLEERWLASDKR